MASPSVIITMSCPPLAGLSHLLFENGDGAFDSMFFDANFVLLRISGIESDECRFSR